MVRPGQPSSEELSTCVATSATFAGAYWWSNHLTSLRTDIGSAVFEWERGIPFVAWTIVPYLSVCVFFALSFFAGFGAVERARHVARIALVLVVSVACYAVFPLRFMFERPAVEGLFGPLYQLLGACDLPYNRAPSLHIAILVLLWVHFVPAQTRVWRAGLRAWFFLIGVSVLTTYQHHVVDVLAGLALGAIAVSVTPARSAALACRRKPA